MLSTSCIKDAAQASHYFSAEDNYYIQDASLLPSEWFGKGAASLGLEGAVSDQRFTELLQGKIVEGITLGTVVDGVMKHRPGWDLTFSAPKSVSSMAFVGGDKRLISAHREAVLITLMRIEQDCAEARRKVNGAIQFEHTKNLIAALYHHELSRANDPQMHTHCVIMNATKCADEKWRSMASTMGDYGSDARGDMHGLIERVRHHNRYYAKLYETELAFRVKALGYDLVTNPETGVFEIASVPKEVVDAFSKRRKTIEAAMEERGLSGGKAAANVTLFTRDRKEKVDRAALQQEWQETTKAMGIDLKERVAGKVKTKTLEVTPKKMEQMAQAVIRETAHELAVFQTTFTLEQLVEKAGDAAIAKNVNVGALLHAVQHAVSQGNLLEIANDNGKTVLMAKSTLEDENRLENGIKEQAAWKKVSKRKLAKGIKQHDALQEKLKAVFGSDTIVLVEGEANKQGLLQPIVEIGQASNLKIAVLSPSMAHSKQLAKQLQPAPQNLWERVKALFVDQKPTNHSVMQFLSQQQNRRGANVPHLLLVDQAHLLSTHQKAALVTWSNRHRAKLVLFGNQKQLLAQQVTAPLKQLTDLGVKTIAESSLEKPTEISAALKQLAGRILEVPHAEDRQHAMALHFAKLPSKEQQSSWIAAISKTSAEQLNFLVHAARVKDQQISETVSISILEPVFISPEKARHAASFAPKQMVRFNDHYQSLKVKRGDYLRVVRVSKPSNRVVLQNKDGERIVWRPDKVATAKIEVFVEKQREVGVGERITWLRSMKQMGLVKGEHGRVDKIHENTLTFSDANGKQHKIDLTKPESRHLDYAYAAPLHAIAHEKSDALITDCPATALCTHQRRLNQVMAQTKDVWVYTDDANKLSTTLAKQTGDRVSVSETLIRSEAIKASLHEVHDRIEKALEKMGKVDGAERQAAIAAVHHAVQHLSERQAGFSQQELLEAAMHMALGDVTAQTVHDAVTAMSKTDMVLQKEHVDGVFWTTAEAVKTERTIMALVQEAQGQLKPIADAAFVEKHIDASVLREEQVAAIQHILQSTDRVLAIQGRAGTGKTTMMTALQQLLATKELNDGKGYELLGIAPTHKAVKELTERGIPAKTIDRFLLDLEQSQGSLAKPDFSKTLLVVDEASMVSNNKMQAVLQVTHDWKFCRMISMGDIEQNPAIEAGKPQALAQQSLQHVIGLHEIQRQKDPVIKHAALAVYEGNVRQAFALLDKNIIEVKGNSDKPYGNSKEERIALYGKRVEMLVADYMHLREQGEAVQIIAPSHQDRKMINHEVRRCMQEKGWLEGKTHVFPVFSSKDKTIVERSQASQFQVGDILRFARSSSKALQGGEYFRIKTIDPKHQVLVLNKLNGDGKDIVWQVPRAMKNQRAHVEVFKQETREMQVGDQISWIRTDQKRGFISAELAKVTDIQGPQVTIQQANNKTMTFDANSPACQHWDHAYALTTYSTQGGTYSTVLAFFESWRKNLMNLKTFLVTITRPVNQLRIYTDDKKALETQIAGHSGDKQSSLEVIGEYPEKAAQHENRSHRSFVKSGRQVPHLSAGDVAKGGRSGSQKVSEMSISKTQREADQVAKELPQDLKIESVAKALAQQELHQDKTLQRAIRHEIVSLTKQEHSKHISKSIKGWEPGL